MALRLRVQLPGGAIEEVILPENGPTATVAGYEAAVGPAGYKVLEVLGTTTGVTVEVISQEQLMAQGYLGPNQVLQNPQAGGGGSTTPASSCDMGVCGVVSSPNPGGLFGPGGNLPAGNAPGTLPVVDNSGGQNPFGGKGGGLLSNLLGGSTLPTGGQGAAVSSGAVSSVGFDWWMFLKGPLGILLLILLVILFALQQGKGRTSPVPNV